MLTKIALATALAFATISTAMAAPETDPNGGYREEGAGGIVTDGVNPVFHPSMRKSAGEPTSCEQRFKSFDPTSGTYLGFDGKRHPCS